MNLASYRREAPVAAATNEAALLNQRMEQEQELSEISDMAERFKRAHARLNDIELELHINLQSGDRLSLLRNLEEARMEYSDARFALSTRSEISSRR